MNATALREVEVYQNGDVHLSIEPNSTQGTILDARGELADVPKRGLMVRIDAKASEQVTLSKGTIWMIGIIPVILALVLNYGAAAFGWVRDDQSQKLQLQQLQNDVNSIKEDVRTMQQAQQMKDVKDAEKRGYQLGAIDNDTGHANIKK